MKARPAFSLRSSFTLVEMLTAMAVLFLLLVLIFGIVGSTLSVSDSATRRADVSIEAKEVLDHIAADIAGMIVRPDVDQFYYTGVAGENDKMFFYSQSTGFFDSGVISSSQSPVSFVGYRIDMNTSVNPAAPVLERLAQGLTWDSGTDPLATGTMDPAGSTTNLIHLTFPSRALSGYTYATNNVTPNAGAITSVWGPSGAGTGYAGVGAEGVVGSSGGNYDDGASPFYDAIGSQTFRLEVCFQRQDGSYSLYPGYTNSAPVYPVSINNTVAIVVAIAVLDSKSRKLVPAASWTKLIAALPNPTTANFSASPPVLMDSVWNTQLQQSTFASTAAIPALAASHIKVYQRYYYLNAPKAQ